VLALGSSDVDGAGRRSCYQIALWYPSMPPVLLSVTLPPKRRPSQLSTRRADSLMGTGSPSEACLSPFFPSPLEGEGMLGEIASSLGSSQ